MLSTPLESSIIIISCLIAAFGIYWLVDRFRMHNILFIISRHEEDAGGKGYAIFDTEGRFLCCNQNAYRFWPLLKEQSANKKLPADSPLCLTFYSMIEAYKIREKKSLRFEAEGMNCVCEITPFSLNKGRTQKAWVFDVRDATEEQHKLDDITAYNKSLNEQVEKEKSNILQMQAKIVKGMADMIENRDNNTGGHVKRTSDIIEIIIKEIRKRDILDIDDSYGLDIVRAAPMHDLGKISIENSVLNKPSRLTDDEYAIMKTHAAKSSEMVRILLDGVEEEHFVNVAFNVARYHHERWDGRGYPDGLVGSMIPLEARIMAVADVYDALASKRSYKEAMDPELVAKIMMEGMGTQFDPAMKPVFCACREQLEEYYQKIQ